MAVTVTKDATLKGCETQPSSDPNVCERHAITCTQAQHDTLDYYCKSVIDTGVLSSRMEWPSSPAQTFLTRRLVVYKKPVANVAGDLLFYLPDVFLQVYDEASLSNLSLDHGIGCSFLREKFDSLRDIKKEISFYDTSAYHPAYTLNRGKILWENGNVR